MKQTMHNIQVAHSYLKYNTELTDSVQTKPQAIGIVMLIKLTTSIC
jgi:hypothetical protein